MYLGVKENQTQNLLAFDSVYDIFGISMIFMECTADQIDSDFQCHFIRYTWIISEEFSHSNFEDVAVYSKDEVFTVQSFQSSIISILNNA